MALSDIILNKGEVIVIPSASLLGLEPDGIALTFGTVQSVNELCDTVTVGDSVWFDIKDALPFTIISGQVFYKLREDKITGKENYIP